MGNIWWPEEQNVLLLRQMKWMVSVCLARERKFQKYFLFPTKLEIINPSFGSCYCHNYDLKCHEILDFSFLLRGTVAKVKDVLESGLQW